VPKPNAVIKIRVPPFHAGGLRQISHFLLDTIFLWMTFQQCESKGGVGISCQ